MRALSATLFALLASLAAAQTPKPPPAKAAAAKVSEILNSIKADDDFPRARQALSHLFDEVIAFAPDTDLDSFREAAFAVRLTSQLAQAPTGQRAELLAYLRTNDTLAQSLVFLIKPEDKLPGLYALLNRLRAKHTDLNNHAALTAAICVVHDQPLSQRVNENKVDAPDPVDLFEFFASSRRAAMPPELLISIVDATSTIDELRWASKKYAGDAKVGDRYFDIKYDTSAFLQGSVKKVTAAGFNLRNILEHGGVCADQAYFAAQVGKAIGVPTAYISGRNAEVSHAWIGYLETRNGRASWNFDSGRYDGYKGVRGETLDPQTRKRIPDSSLALLADTSAANTIARRNAIALTDAALRLAAIAKDTTPFPPSEPSTLSAKKTIRTASIEHRLTLLEAALRKCPTYAPGWAVLIAAAKNGELSYKDKKRWAEVLDKLCAGKYPDFSLDILRPMVETVEDPKEQSALWDSLFTGFQKRPDLASEIRFAQGAMWEQSGDRAKAWDCYQDVIKRFADDGPFTVDAARRCEKLLRDSNKVRDIAPLYAALWPRLTAPKSAAAEFRSQSNWFRIGTLYAATLDRDGQSAQANDIRTKLGIPKG
jgi:hypothetical protein